MSFEVFNFVIDLQILGPKKKRSWLHVHFNLALAQDAAGDMHLPRHLNKYLIQIRWEDGWISPSDYTSASVSTVESGR